MEKLLTLDSVEEMTEYGQSEKYHEINWETSVESFYEPITSQMWIQGVCSAEYIDSDGQEQSVELTHWLTNLTAEDALKMLTLKRESMDSLGGHVIDSIEEAADYLGVSKEMILAWEADGMIKTEDGRYITDYLDLYKKYEGNPPTEAVEKAATSYKELKKEAEQAGKTEDPSKPEKEKDDDGTKPKPEDEDEIITPPEPEPESAPCGLTMALYRENPSEFWKLMWSCDEF